MLPDIGWLRLAFVGICVALAVGVIVDMVRYETRRRIQPLPSHQIKILLARQIDAIKKADGAGKLHEIFNSGLILTGALGDKAAHEFLDNIGDLREPIQATPLAISYLEGLICRDDLRYEPRQQDDDWQE
jgi:hypothetical protein